MPMAKDWSQPENGRYAELDHRATSDAASALGAAIVARLDAKHCRNTARGAKRQREMEHIAAAFAADLLAARRIHPQRWSWRTLNPNDYSKRENGVGYHSFRLIYETMKSEGWLEIGRKGSYDRDPIWHDMLVPPRGMATRFRATEAFVAFAQQHGLSPENLKDHFVRQLKPPKEVLELRTQSARDLSFRKHRGAKVKFIENQTTKALEFEVRVVNDFLIKQRIDGAEHRGFKRMFTLPTGMDVATYAWNKHGRFYSVGDDSYQLMDRDARLKILINGEAVAEIDIRASHLTILHATLGAPFDAVRDPYDLGDLPRSIVKSWITMTIGNGKPHRSWPKEKTEEYALENPGRRLQEDYPISEVRDRILDRLPILKRLGEPGTSIFDLMFVESEGVWGAVMELAYRNVPALPIHDSLIVPGSASQQAQVLLKKHYRQALAKHCGVGIEPALKVHEGDEERLRASNGDRRREERGGTDLGTLSPQCGAEHPQDNLGQPEEPRTT